MFKDIFVRKLLKRFLDRPRNPDFNPERIDRVVCLVDLDGYNAVENLSVIGEIIKNKQFEILGFTKNEKIDSSNRNPILSHVVSKEEYNFFGKISDDILKERLMKKCDLLINYFCKPNHCILLSSIFANTKLRAGFSSIDKGYNDIVLNVSPDPQIFAEEVTKYINPKYRI